MTDSAYDPRLPWVQADWLAEATRWIRTQLDERGIAVTGEIEQVHARWWSTILRVPTSDEPLFFKASAPVHAFEPALIALLEKLRPGHIPELVAHDAGRGWMLMRDGGARLREEMHSAGNLARWEELLPDYAELQIALVTHVDELLAAGVPDRRLAELPGLFERLLDDDEALMLGLPDGITPEEREQLRTFAPELAATSRQLAAFGVPETLQHDDFHDGNIFIRDGRYLFFDWGDSCISHPFHTLVVTFRSLGYKFSLEAGGPELTRLRDAYLEPFRSYGTPDDLVAATELAHVTGTVGRTLAWHRFIEAHVPEFREDNAETIPYGLRRVLAGGPLGSWR